MITVTASQLRPTLIRLTKKYGKAIDKMGVEIAEEMAKEIVRSARRRAPRGFTGNLRLAIGYSMLKGKTFVVGIDDTIAPYGSLQELGYRPHWVSVEKHPELTTWAMYKFGKANRNPYWFVRKSAAMRGGFIRPAIQDSLDRTPSYVEKWAQREIGGAVE